SRYPRKARTKDNQRMLYCAWVMAGICCRVSPATAVDKLRKLKHPKVRKCHCPDCTNFKAALFQWILFDLHEIGKRSEDEEVWSSATLTWRSKLDNSCDCTHCRVMALAKKALRPQGERSPNTNGGHNEIVVKNI